MTSSPQSDRLEPRGDPCPTNDRALYRRMLAGSYWAAQRLAIEMRQHGLTRGDVDRALRRLQRRGLAAATGQLWYAIDVATPAAVKAGRRP